MTTYKLLSDGVQIEEVPNEMEILPLDFRPEKADLNAGARLLVQEDGSLEKFELYTNNDPGKEIDALIDDTLEYNLAFKNSKVYQITQDKIDTLVHKFEAPTFEPFRYFAIITKDYFLMNADLKEVNYAKPILWQVHKTTFETLKISEEPYYTSERPPLIIKPERYTGTIVVYYVGDISFGYGGDSSRPEQSIIRIYDQKNPQGKDLIQLSFAAGTIVDIEMDNADFLVYTDSSLPSSVGKPRVAPKTWRISIN
ncbi:hypothetical protein GCM10022259_14420 [Aquimarina mytili]